MSLFESIAVDLISSGLSKFIEGIGLEQKQFFELVSRAPIQINYQSNFCKYILKGSLSDYSSKLSIYNLSEKTGYLAVRGYFTPLNGPLLGPYTTYYKNTSSFSFAENNEPLKFPSHGKLDFDTSIIFSEIANLKEYFGGVATEFNSSPVLLSNEFPKGKLNISSEQKTVKVLPIKYNPPLPTVSPYRGLGVVLDLEFFYYDLGISITRTLYGGVAIKSPDSDILSIRKEKKFTEARIISFLDDFYLAPSLIIKSLLNSKKAFWITNPIKEEVNHTDLYLEKYNKLFKNLSMNVIRLSVTRSARDCPSYINVLLIAPVGKYLNEQVVF